MKKATMIFFSIAFLLLFGTVTAGAQVAVRLDGGISVPVVVGGVFPSLGISESATVPSFIPIPEFQAHIQFDLSPVKLGLGARFFTAIIATLVYPNIYAELDLDPVVINLSVGGGAFVIFGMLSGSATGTVIAPDLNVAFKVTDWFKIGTGVIGIMDLQYLDVGFLYIWYLSARFSATL